LCIAVYLALVFAPGIVMALPAPRDTGPANSGDDDF
jgi:hypothetical protein